MEDELTTPVEQIGKRPSPVGALDGVLLGDAHHWHPLTSRGELVRRRGDGFFALTQLRERDVPLGLADDTRTSEGHALTVHLIRRRVEWCTRTDSELAHLDGLLTSECAAGALVLVRVVGSHTDPGRAGFEVVEGDAPGVGQRSRALEADVRAERRADHDADRGERDDLSHRFARSRHGDEDDAYRGSEQHPGCDSGEEADDDSADEVASDARVRGVRRAMALLGERTEQRDVVAVDAGRLQPFDGDSSATGVGKASGEDAGVASARPSVSVG